MKSPKFCAHCGIEIYRSGLRQNNWWHVTGSRTCMSAVTDEFEFYVGGAWTDELYNRRESLRGKTPYPA